MKLQIILTLQNIWITDWHKRIRERIRHIKKSPDLFGSNDTDSSAFASNVSMAENGFGQSEIIEGSK